MVLLLSGCATLQSKLPTVLVTSELQWTIPAGVTFKAIQKPAYPKLTEFTVADQELVIISKGNLLELEQEANNRAIKAARGAKKEGVIWGSIGSLLAFLSALVAKFKLLKRKESKQEEKNE